MPCPWLIAAVTLTFSAAVYCAEPTDNIMRKVAENQDRLGEERDQFVYDQHVRVRSGNHKGKLICVQDSEYTVIPKAMTSEHQLVRTKLQYKQGEHFVDSDKDLKAESETLDTGLVKSMRDELILGNSKDGLRQNLYPLSTDQQKAFEFQLNGEQMVNGRSAYVIAFRPKDHKEYGWAGEAIIDKQEYQPIRVYNQMSRKLPFYVRTLLGTDVPGLGFTMQEKRLDQDIWFPATFGAEFRIRAVYFFRRTISISMENTNFRRTNVDTKLEYKMPN